MMKLSSIAILKSEEGNPSLENVEDDDEFEKVTDCFDELLDEEDFDKM